MFQIELMMNKKFKFMSLLILGTFGKIPDFLHDFMVSGMRPELPVLGV